MIERLADVALFSGVSREEIQRLLEEVSVSSKRYHQGELILDQASPYRELYILLRGQSYARMLDFRGRELKIETFKAPSVFAPAVLFASMNYMPGSVIADSTVEVAIIDKEGVLRLCALDQRFLKNYLRLISDKFLFISKRLGAMSFKTIREKLANYLLDLKGDREGRVTLPMPLEKLAGYFGVSRPSLSRVIGQLEEQGVIRKEKKVIQILDIDALLEEAPED